MVPKFSLRRIRSVLCLLMAIHATNPPCYLTGLLLSGPGIGTMAAFLTGWSLWAVSRLPMEVGILGWRLTLVRLASTFFFPPIAGWIAQTLFGNTA